MHRMVQHSNVMHDLLFESAFADHIHPVLCTVELNLVDPGYLYHLAYFAA